MGIEKLTTLAFSMYTNKGAYALLLGSGISRSAGIPSGWEVEEKLIEMIAYPQSLKRVADQDDWHQWYRVQYEESPSYSSLLGKLVGTSTERVPLMRPFFEPKEEEKEKGIKQPTKAHKAIARLVKEGYIRVILTTNFDRLLERALEAEGITPQVISHEGAIAQATPLVHSDRPTLVKINGDYIDCNFRNTSEELDIYPEEMKYYLQRIFEDYGLVTCGWSADWDKGLIDIIKSSPHPRYSSFFTSVGNASNNLTELSKIRGGEIMPIKGADELFSELCEQVMALEKYAMKADMDQVVRTVRLKRFLSDEQYRMEFADVIEKWGKEAHKEINEHGDYNFELTPESFARYLNIHRAAVAPLLDAAILTARWGKEWQLELIGKVVVKLCTRVAQKDESEDQNSVYLHALAPMLLLNALGIACVENERFKELNAILGMLVPGTSAFDSRWNQSLLSLFGGGFWDDAIWSTMMEEDCLYPISTFLYRNLYPFFEDSFLISSQYPSIFNIWEHLRTLIYAYNKCCVHERTVLLGNFFRHRAVYRRICDSIQFDPYMQFFEKARRLKNDWEPIKQGMFGGRYRNYRRVYKQVEKHFPRDPFC